MNIERWLQVFRGITNATNERTVLYLLRLRCLIQVERRERDGSYSLSKSLLAEECLGLAVRGIETPKLLTDDDALSLLSLKASRNMPKGQKSHFLRQALNASQKLEATFERFAHEKAQQLLADHRRIREASDTRGLRYDVKPALPIDKIGIYVFLPVVSL